MSLNYPEIKTESFLTFLTSLFSLLSLLSLLFFTSLHHFSHFCLLSEVLCFIFLLDKSLIGPEMNTESFLSLRTFKKFSVFLSLVKVFHFCLYLGFIVLFTYIFLPLQLHVCTSTLPASANVKALVGFGAPTVQALTYPKWGLGGRWTNKASSAQS